MIQRIRSCVLSTVPFLSKLSTFLLAICFQMCYTIYMKNYITKDSGKRIKYKSGFNRDIQEGKPRYDLIPTKLLTRLALLYTRGAEKYGDNNWRKANTPEEYKRFQASAFRHFVQWLENEQDEDHAIATIWNIIAYEWHTQHKNEKHR